MKYVMIMVAGLSAIMPMQASDGKKTFALCVVGAGCVAGLVSGYFGAKIASRPTQAEKELALKEGTIRREQVAEIQKLKTDFEQLKASFDAHQEQACTDREAMLNRLAAAESRVEILAGSAVELTGHVQTIASSLASVNDRVEGVHGLYHELDSKIRSGPMRRFVVTAPRSPTAGYPDELNSSDEEGVPLDQLGKSALSARSVGLESMAPAGGAASSLPQKDLHDSPDMHARL